MIDKTLHLRVEPDGTGGFRLIKNGMQVPGDLHGLVAYLIGEADVAIAMDQDPALPKWAHDGNPIRLELVLDGYLPAPSQKPTPGPLDPDWKRLGPYVDTGDL